VIISSLCLEAVADTLDEYNLIIGRLATKIKSGGYFVLFGVLEETFYKVGEKTLPCLSLKESDIRIALTKNGFDIVDMKILISK